MPQQRTTQDIYAMIVPNTPLEDDYDEGDEITVQHRVERIAEHGWIEDYKRTNGTYTAVLTDVGAAVINYFRESLQEGELGERMDAGAGNFVDDALDSHGITPESWTIVEISDDQVTLENQSGESRTYGRSTENSRDELEA